MDRIVSIPLREDILSNIQIPFNVSALDKNVSIPLREDILSNVCRECAIKEIANARFNSPQGRYLI